MKAITFLGTTDYKCTNYVYDGREFPTRFFAAALPHFFPELERILVFCTPTVEQHPNLAALRERLGDLLQPVPIPAGHSETELWQIFDALTEAVVEKDVVLFDITNSFRSIPMLVFLAAAYLRATRQVSVHRVIYGAFEARDEVSNRTPVFDLSPFVSLLDWLTATDRFIQTGDGRPLASLVRDAAHFEHPRRKLTSQEQTVADASKRINSAASAIEETSQALLTTLIPQAERASHLLSIRLAEAESDLARRLPPYRLLARRVRATYTPFALETPMAGRIENDLGVQLDLIGWYLDNGHVPQAVTLMREWMVTAVGYRLGMPPSQLLDYNTGRRPIAEALSWVAHYRPPDPGSSVPVDEPPPYGADLRAWPTARELALFWNQLTDPRNLINHAAMRKNWPDIKSGKVVEQIRALYEQLRHLAQPLMEADQ